MQMKQSETVLTLYWSWSTCSCIMG